MNKKIEDKKNKIDIERREKGRKIAMEILNKYIENKDIIDHCIVVNKFSIRLVRKISTRGSIDMRLVNMGSLLHDVGRELADKREENHSTIGKEILKKEGFPKIASIVGKHDLFSIFNNELKLEEKIVYYSDKRVEGNKIVSLEKRFKGLLNRHPEDKDKILMAKPLVKKLEKELIDNDK